MNLAFKKTLVFLFTLVFQCCLAQSIDLYQKQLPYTIPVLQSDTATQAYEWRWLENGAVIPGADSSVYIVPTGKAAGSYLFIDEVKCGLCADWLSSNPFEVVIHSNPGNPTAAISATFSPQLSMQGYLQQLISVIDNTRQSLDISLYHFESYEVYKALERATTRGVKIRLLYDEAQEDRKSTEGTVSHQVENTGADIRYTPLILSKGTVDYYLISDIRGSVRMVVKSSSGELRQKISYDAFGNILEDTSPGYTPFGFAGGLYYTRTGLLRFGARDYSPETGRWTAEDSIGFWSGDINFYAYVGNDPVNFVDPSGLSRDEVNGLTNHQLVSIYNSGVLMNLWS